MVRCCGPVPRSTADGQRPRPTGGQLRRAGDEITSNMAERRKDAQVAREVKVAQGHG